MKISSAFILLLSLSGILSAQQENKPVDVSHCTSMRFDTHRLTPEQMEKMNADYHDYLVKRDPKWDARRNAFEEQVQQVIASGKVNPHSQSAIVLPVVIHVVYNSPSSNISMTQALSQITVLNEDFGRTNADTVNTPAAFQPVAANTGIQFCLAQRDPNGNPTTGVEYRQTTVPSFTANDAVKFYAQGGLDIWDPTRYLNIWVCDFGSSGLLGYGEFPTGSPTNTYGVVIQYDAFGNTGTVSAPYNLGRTTTHEFSHCFNLYHIWGDDGNACTGSDLCADTPNQAGSTFGCFTFPHTDACSPTSPGIMFMNYMDYTDDACLNMFTQNQSTRMNAVLSVTPYNALSASNGCVPVVLMNDDAAITIITTPNGNSCSLNFTPVVVLKNWGANALTSCVISYQVDANTPSVYSWTGSLASLATTPVTLSPMSTTSGAHTFTAYTTMPNGVTDAQPSNDQTTSNFTVFTSGVPLPYSEGFESTTFVPAGWSYSNPDGSNTWQRTTQAAKSGVASAYMDNYNYSSGMGQTDDIITMPLDLTSVSNPVMTFEYAYVYYVDGSGTYTDSLGVYISTDCGTTWSQLFKQGGAQLATATPVFNTNNEFDPTSSQWNFKLISLSAYQSSTNVMIRFRNISGYGDQMYLDNINILNANGVNDVSGPLQVALFPNPSTGQTLLQYTLPGTGEAQVIVRDVLGRTLMQTKLQGGKTGSCTIDLGKEDNGVYFVQLIAAGGSVTEKLVLKK
jgi:hypothetical protein